LLIYVLSLLDTSSDTQHDFVFAGSVKVWMLEKMTGETVKTIYKANDYIAIPPYTPHIIFEFLEDTVMAEWWDGPFQAWFYQPYRCIVERSFVAAAPTKQKSGRHFSLLVEQQKRGVLTSFLSVMKDQWWWSGMLLGISLGYMMGRQTKWRRAHFVAMLSFITFCTVHTLMVQQNDKRLWCPFRSSRPLYGIPRKSGVVIFNAKYCVGACKTFWWAVQYCTVFVVPLLHADAECIST